MPQFGIPYVLTGPDGTRAVFNDPTDLDFVGYLDSDNGLTGLLDTADVRESFTNHVENNGASQGNNYLGRRVGTLQGILNPNTDIATMVLSEQKIKRASRALKAASPAILSWSPAGIGMALQLRVWRQGVVRFTNRRPKNFLIPLATEDAYSYSTALSSAVLLPTGQTGELGFSNPMANPLISGINVAAQQYISNQGDVETWPIFVIRGPITNPGLRNNTTNYQWQLIATLQSTDTMTVDTLKRTVVLNGTASRYSTYAANFAGNQWWPLQPGANDVRLLSSAFSAGAQVTVQWRHAFE